jgi:hypothetical protein
MSCGNEGGWLLSDGTLVQNAGTVANGMWQGTGATWIFLDSSSPFCPPCDPGVFALNGGTTIASTPEPASMALLGSGLIGLGARLRKRWM